MIQAAVRPAGPRAAESWRNREARARERTAARGRSNESSPQRGRRAVGSRLHMFTLFFLLSRCRLDFCVIALSIRVPVSLRVLFFCSFSHVLSLFLRLQKLLFALGGSFLYYADHFKLYSGFCANHIKVQKVLERGTVNAYTHLKRLLSWYIVNVLHR